jgi:outer membrane protein TolC
MKIIYALKLFIGLLVFIITLPTNATASENEPLTLAETENIALALAPELKQIQANSDALKEQAIAEGQLPDPQLMVGAANVPTDTFSFTQDDMTMVQVGLRQSFAPGKSLAMKSKKMDFMADAQQQKLSDQKAMLLKNIRTTWLDLYYWNAAAKIIDKNKKLFKELLEDNEAEYSQGRRNQSDILQVRIDLSRLNIQSAEIEQQIATDRAQLARWIGVEEANRIISSEMPHWMDPPNINDLQEKLLQHPLLKADLSNIDAAHYDVAYAKEQFKPGWMLDVGYAKRQGKFQDGQPRTDMVNAQISIDLPIFTANRQDRKLLASVDQLNSTELDRDIHMRDLFKELNTEYTLWQSLTNREKIFREDLHKEAHQNAKAALMAYQNTTGDLSTLLKAYSNELNIRMEQVQLKVERAKARVALLYLEGLTE